MDNVKDKVIIITGASSGIGKETATQLASKGAKLVLAARRESVLREITDEIINKYGTPVIYKATDITNKNDVAELIQFTENSFGRIDVLFNNAGLMPVSMLRDGKVDEWESMIDINIKGALYGIKYALPIMEEQGQGQIITTDSVAGHFTGVGSAVYSATKAAIRSIMEGLRVEEVAKDIKSTLISPGHTQTDLASTITDPLLREAVLKSELETGLSASDVAQAVIYSINTPKDVGINEIILRSTNQRDY